MKRILCMTLLLFIDFSAHSGPCEGTPAAVCTGLNRATCGLHYRLAQPAGQCVWVENCKNGGNCCLAKKNCTPD